MANNKPIRGTDLPAAGVNISRLPMTAIPLDIRQVFLSLELAEQAAATAVPVGSDASYYYYGMTLSVVDGTKAEFYIIQPNKTLSKVEGGTDSYTKAEIDEMIGVVQTEVTQILGEE